MCDLLTIDLIYLKKQSDGLGCTVSLLLTKDTEIECDQSLTGLVGSNRNSPSINPVTKKWSIKDECTMGSLRVAEKWKKSSSDRQK